LENPGRISGTSTGFSALDQLIGGLPNGETIVLGSQHGKDVSILAQNIVQRLAIEQAKRVFWISTRDREIDLVSRMVRARSLITDAELKKGLLSRAKQDSLAKAVRDIQIAPIELFAAFSATVGQILGRLNSLSRDDVDVLLIDDVLSLDGFDSPGMFRKLVTTARKPEIPVICVARVNKAQRRSFDNPLESIDSGIEIMNEAAVTALLQLPDPHEIDWDEENDLPPKSRPAYLRVIKSDFGGLGDVALMFNQELALFTERTFE
jgi:replicative DNA helicase